METKDALFEMDDEGWIAQNRGRNLWELFRELMQNAMDGEGETITVKVDSRQRQIEVIDDGPGFENLADAYRIFGGDKGGDPTKRGRFGRGLKEFVASTSYTKLETTSGVVEWDVTNRTRSVDETIGRENGTRVVARNPSWQMSEVKEIWKYVMKIWPPEGMKFVVDLKGGRTTEKTREDGWLPKFETEMYLKTVQLNEETGVMEDTYRNTAVHIRDNDKSGQSGRLYEMGIPVDLKAPFPYYVDVQQKIPMAEQRNEPDSWWYNRKLKPMLVETLYENGEFEEMTEKELRADWFVEALDRCGNQEAKEYWLDRIIQDGRRKGLVIAEGENVNDKVEQHGYQVFDTAKAGAHVAGVVKEVADTASAVAREIADTEKRRVEPTPDQRNFIRQMEDLVSMAGVDVTYETWYWEPAPNGRHSVAAHQDGVIRLNTYERNWDELTPENVGTALLHEPAHVETNRHDQMWWKKMQNIGGEIITGLLGE